jgi:hexosaminidase
LELGTGQGIWDVILCAGKEATYDFAGKLLAEIAPLFNSPYFHLGGDEAPKVEWEGCEHCKAALNREGLANFEDLQGYFTRRLAEGLKEKGKRVVCWNDVLHASVLPQDLEIQYWAEWGDLKPLTAFFDRGGRVVFSHLYHLYLDYPPSVIPLRRVYEYRPLIGDRDCSAAPNTAGIQACLWSERKASPQALEEAIFPRLFAVAEDAWTLDRDYDDFEKRLIPKLQTLKDRGVAFTPLSQCNLQGEARVQEIAQFCREFLGGLRVSGEHKAPDAAEVSNILDGFVRGFDLPPVPRDLIGF